MAQQRADALRRLGDPVGIEFKHQAGGLEGADVDHRNKALAHGDRAALAHGALGFVER